MYINADFTQVEHNLFVVFLIILAADESDVH